MNELNFYDIYHDSEYHPDFPRIRKGSITLTFGWLDEDGVQHTDKLTVPPGMSITVDGEIPLLLKDGRLDKDAYLVLWAL